jgi:hypothetical protein
MVPSPLGAGSGSGSGSAVARTGAGSGSAVMVASPYVWLVDDSDDDGALAIRCQFGVAGKPETGARVAVGGAWTLDSDRRWIWQVDAVTALPPASGSAAPALQAQGHAIALVNQLPAGAHTISIAKEGELAYFQLDGLPPAVDGDGWPVADDLGNPVYALLNLPGERASYGAQDMRAADERWSLRRGVTYIARLGHIHKHGDKPATINARSAVMRLP